MNNRIRIAKFLSIIDFSIFLSNSGNIQTETDVWLGAIGKLIPAKIQFKKENDALLVQIDEWLKKDPNCGKYLPSN